MKPATVVVVVAAIAAAAVLQNTNVNCEIQHGNKSLVAHGRSSFPYR